MTKNKETRPPTTSPGPDLPSAMVLEAELKREQRRLDRRRSLRCALALLLFLAALTAAVLCFPAVRVSDDAMDPVLKKGDIVLADATGTVRPGDVVAFTYLGQIRVRRVLARGGDQVNITGDGTVYVNNLILDEPYASGIGTGPGDGRMPVRVPADSYFVLGDRRDASADDTGGCVERDRIIGVVRVRIWPFRGLVRP